MVHFGPAPSGTFVKPVEFKASVGLTFERAMAEIATKFAAAGITNVYNADVKIEFGEYVVRGDGYGA